VTMQIVLLSEHCLRKLPHRRHDAIHGWLHDLWSCDVQEITQRKWQMLFNVNKCKVMHFGRRDAGYNPKSLDEVSEEKDLGVTIICDLKASHVPSSVLMLTVKQIKYLVSSIDP